MSEPEHHRLGGWDALLLESEPHLLPPPTPTSLQSGHTGVPALLGLAIAGPRDTLLSQGSVADLGIWLAGTFSEISPAYVKRAAPRGGLTLASMEVLYSSPSLKKKKG